MTMKFLAIIGFIKGHFRPLSMPCLTETEEGPVMSVVFQDVLDGRVYKFLMKEENIGKPKEVEVKNHEVKNGVSELDKDFLNAIAFGNKKKRWEE